MLIFINTYIYIYSFIILRLLITARHDRDAGCRYGRNDFVRVQYALGVHSVFQAAHQVDGLAALCVLQIMRFRRTDPVLGANAPAALGRPSVHERLDKPGQFFVVTGRHYV